MIASVYYNNKREVYC